MLLFFMPLNCLRFNVDTRFNNGHRATLWMRFKLRDSLNWSLITRGYEHSESNCHRIQQRVQDMRVHLYYFRSRIDIPHADISIASTTQKNTYFEKISSRKYLVYFKLCRPDFTGFQSMPKPCSSCPEAKKISNRELLRINYKCAGHFAKNLLK